MSLGLIQDAEVTVYAEGADAQQAVAELVAYLQNAQ